MARLIDEMKLERIKTATQELVVANGYGGASISTIAKKAGVAEGYLYRFYKSKFELVNDLLFTNVNQIADNIELLLENRKDIPEIFEHLIKSFIKLAKTEPDRIKFMFVLMHDYNFNLNEIQRKRIFELCTHIKDIGLKNKQIRENVNEEEIYLIGVAYPIQFINLRLKNFFGKSKISDYEYITILSTCINALKKQ